MGWSCLEGENWIRSVFCLLLSGSRTFSMLSKYKRLQIVCMCLVTLADWFVFLEKSYMKDNGVYFRFFWYCSSRWVAWFSKHTFPIILCILLNVSCPSAIIFFSASWLLNSMRLLLCAFHVFVLMREVCIWYWKTGKKPLSHLKGNNLEGHIFIMINRL